MAMIQTCYRNNMNTGYARVQFSNPSTPLYIQYPYIDKMHKWRISGQTSQYKNLRSSDFFNSTVG